MSLLWTDGTYTTASAVNSPEYSHPIDGLAEAVVLRQDFVQFIANRTPLAIGTAHATVSGFRLVSESEAKDIGGGIGKWTRTYAKKPSTHYDYETYAYNFIGYYGSWGINITAVTGRDRLTRVVPSQIESVYYIVAASGGDHKDVGSIPRKDAQRYLYGDIDTDYIGDTPPLDAATVPSRTVYEAWIADAVEHGFAAGIATSDAGGVATGATNPARIAVESSLSRWMGDIFVRRTRYVLAQ